MPTVQEPVDPRAPDAPAPDHPALDPAAVLTELDEAYPDIDGAVLVGATLALASARTCTVLRSRLTDCDLDLPDDVPIDLQDCVLEGLDLTGRRIVGMAGVELRRCRVGGVDLSDTPVRDTTFRDCVLDLASVRGGRLDRVVIEGGRAEALDCTRARLTDVRVADVDLASVALGGARLERVDLVGARLDGFVEFADLRGATLSMPQALAAAPLLARALGIRVAVDAAGTPGPDG